MKTMKLFAFAAAFLMLLCACKREAVIPAPDYTAGKYMTFKANLSPMGSKSHFGPNEESDGTLYWDSTDQVMVCAVLQFGDGSSMSQHLTEYCMQLTPAGYDTGYTYIGADIDKYFHVALTTPSIDPADGTKATLVSAVTAEELMLERDELTNSRYEFAALYPVQEASNIKLLFWTGTPGVDGGAFPAFPVKIPNVQDGKHYGRYHVCFDAGLDFSMYPYFGTYLASDILNNHATVTFNNLKPSTALLRFNIATDSDTPVEISKLVISIDSDFDKLSGDAFINSWGPNLWFAPNRWEPNAKIYDNVTLQFESPVSVSSTATSEKFYAVVLPSLKDEDPSSANAVNTYDGNTKIKFYAYNANGDLLFHATKSAPSKYYADKGQTLGGFRPGERYDFTLNLTTYPAPINPDAPGAGEYQDGGNPFVGN